MCMHMCLCVCVCDDDNQARSRRGKASKAFQLPMLSSACYDCDHYYRGLKEPPK